MRAEYRSTCKNAMNQQQPIFQNYLLYVRPGSGPSEEALVAAADVLEDTRTVDIDALKTELQGQDLPAWLDGVPLCVDLGNSRQVYRGTECIEFFKTKSSQTSTPGDGKVTEDDLKKFMESRKSS